MRRAVMAILGLAALAACDGIEIAPGQLEYANLSAETRRAYDAAYRTIPFAQGPVSVLATEGGELRTFALVPCRGGARICAGSARGRAGNLTVTPDFWIVTGLYGNRQFHLSPGGDGMIVRGGRQNGLAWN